MAIKVGEKDLFPYLGDYGPVSIYKGEQKLAGYKWAKKSGQELHFDNTYNSHVHVKVDGQSYQHAEPTPDNPSEIHSLNDFDVVSSAGKENYWAIAKKPWHSYLEHMGGGVFTNASTSTSFAFMTMSKLEVDVGEEYTISFEIKVSDESTQFTNRTLYVNDATPNARHNRPTLVKDEWVKVFATFDYTVEKAGRHAHIYFTQIPSSGSMEFRNLKLEKGNTATPYIPAPEDITEDSNHPLIDKINLNLSEPLRSVGDVKDRLFKDNDGLWKVERNVGEVVIDGTEKKGDWSHTYGCFAIPAPNIRPNRTTPVSNCITNTEGDIPHIISSNNSATLWVLSDENWLTNSTDFNEWAKEKNNSGQPLVVQYELNNSTAETLDQELQDQLNTLKSFKGSNYVYTVQNTDNPHKEQLKPTLHAKTEVKDI